MGNVTFPADVQGPQGAETLAYLYGQIAPVAQKRA